MRRAIVSALNRHASYTGAWSSIKHKVIYNHAMSDPESDPSSTSPAPASRPPAAPAASATPGPVGEFRIGEEFGTAKRNLPPAWIVLLCLVAVAIVVGIFAFKGRAKPQGAGSIDFVAAAEVPGQDAILAAITLTLRNTAARPLWIKSLTAQLTTTEGKTLEDEAASAVDLDRYFHAFPALQESAEPPLPPETKLLAGAQQKGTIVVSFKVSREEFDQRKSLTVTIQPYDQPLPVVLH